MNHKLIILLAILVISHKPSLQCQTIVNDIASLQSAIVAAAEGEVIKLSSSFPPVILSTITIAINHTNNVILDGDGKTLEIGGNYRHFNISKSTSAGTLTIRNIELKGLRTNTNGISSGPGGGGVTVNSNSRGVIAFDNVYFNSIQSGALTFSSLDQNAIIRVSNSTFRNNNKGDHGGAIFYQNSGNLEVLNCTFDENYNAGAGYSGGAIVCFNHSGNFTVKRSVFINNLSMNWGGAIGVYSPRGNTSSVSIDSCYFEGNRVTIANGNGDGGAVSIFGNAGQVTRFDLRNSTFYNNHASDDGGALFIQNYDTGASNYIGNCSMYENSADDVNPATYTLLGSTFNIATSGGAIQLSLRTPVTLEHNTIIENFTRSSYHRGGGLGFHAASSGRPNVTLTNNIILGNYILNGSTKIYNEHANVGFRAFYNPSVTLNGNVGYDNGTSLPSNVTVLNTFGNNNPVKWENFTAAKVGNPYESNVAYSRVLPSISVKPNDGVNVHGLADRQGGTTSLSTDKRGYQRDFANPNIGSVEIRWAKFDANGGSWPSLPNLSYNGTLYYEKDGTGSVDYCYQITYCNGAISYFSNLPERPGHVFQYWALDSVNGARWDGSPLSITVNRSLYAIWRSGFLSFDNDTICENEKADLTNLKLLSGTLTGVTLNYYLNSLCTLPVPDPQAVGRGTYYITGLNQSNQRDTAAVNIVENELVRINLGLEEDTCFYKKLDGLILEIIDTSKIMIPGTGQWFLGKKVIDPETYALSSMDHGKMLYYQVETKCGVARSNMIEVEICRIAPDINRAVTIPEVTGLNISLPPGIHYVKSHNDLEFTITALPGYSLDGLIVKTNNWLWDNEGGIKIIRLSDDSVKVILRIITEPLVVTIEGVYPTANSIIENATVWTYGKQLHVTLEKAITMSVYTITGRLYEQYNLGEGTHTITLPSGIYIVGIDGKSYLKIVIQ